MPACRTQGLPAKRAARSKPLLRGRQPRQQAPMQARLGAGWMPPPRQLMALGRQAARRRPPPQGVSTAQELRLLWQLLRHQRQLPGSRPTRPRLPRQGKAAGPTPAQALPRQRQPPARPPPAPGRRPHQRPPRPSLQPRAARAARCPRPSLLRPPTRPAGCSASQTARLPRPPPSVQLLQQRPPSQAAAAAAAAPRRPPSQLRRRQLPPSSRPAPEASSGSQRPPAAQQQHCAVPCVAAALTPQRRRGLRGRRLLWVASSAGPGGRAGARQLGLVSRRSRQSQLLPWLRSWRRWKKLRGSHLAGRRRRPCGPAAVRLALQPGAMPAVTPSAATPGTSLTAASLATAWSATPCLSWGEWRRLTHASPCNVPALRHASCAMHHAGPASAATCKCLS